MFGILSYKEVIKIKNKIDKYIEFSNKLIDELIKCDLIWEDTLKYNVYQTFQCFYNDEHYIFGNITFVAKSNKKIIILFHSQDRLSKQGKKTIATDNEKRRKYKNCVEIWNNNIPKNTYWVNVASYVKDISKYNKDNGIKYTTFSSGINFIKKIIE